jgi:uncharacterized damage-inducible protein DinB
MTRSFIFTLALTCFALPAAAQRGSSAPAGNPLAGSVKVMHGMVAHNLVAAAEKMPEAEYAFKPTPDVRSFAELVGHVANANFFFCSMAKGEPSPAKANFEKTTAKADLVKAITEAMAYCDGAYNSATDASFAEKIKAALPVLGADNPRGTTLMFNVAHNNEHYGNVVTYMRLKGHVPPSSEPKK